MKSEDCNAVCTHLRALSRITKRATFVDGELCMENGGRLIGATACVMEIAGIDGLFGLIKHLTDRDALVFGVPKNGAKVSQVLTQATLGPGSNAIARDREHFEFAEKPGFLLLDFDLTEDQEVRDIPALLDRVVGAVPALAGAPMAAIPSASSCLVDEATGAFLRGLHGFHAYVLVNDASDIPRAGKVIAQRLWLAGLGRAFVTKSGRVLPRTLVDTAVWQPERLVFSGGASCGPGIIQERTKFTVTRNVHATPLDTKSDLLDLSAQDLSRFEGLQAEVLGRPETRSRADSQRERWLEARLAEIPEPEREQQKEVLRRAAITSELPREFEIRLQGGERVTVGAILDNVRLYDGRRCADPLEPDYRGDNRIAIIQAAAGVIFSHAHGGIHYRLGLPLTGVRLDKTKPPPFEAMELTEEDLTSARLTPTCIVEDYLYADVALLVAPGGTGKTTLQLHELVCIALDRPVFGNRVKKSGWCLFVTAEDAWEHLAARLRVIMEELNLTIEERAAVLARVRFWDVTGEQVKLVRAEGGNVVLTNLADDIIDAYKLNPPVLVVMDPLVSFGASEGQVNDNEQAIITAARRIVRAFDCCVRLVAHTGKNNAREKTLDQYSSRGGSALADGARMVAVLQKWSPDDKGERRPPVGFQARPDDDVILLSRPKLSYAKPNLPLLWIKRIGYRYEWAPDIPVSREQTARAFADQLRNFLRSELADGRKHNKTTCESAITGKGYMTRKHFREAWDALVVSGEIIEVELPKAVQSGRRKTYFDVAASPARSPQNAPWAMDSPEPKDPGDIAAAYRERNGGEIRLATVSPISNSASDTRRDSARLAGFNPVTD